MAEVTIVFADLTGSTGLYEALGNAKATEVVTQATERLGKLCARHGGRVIKYLGDGVLLSFAHNGAAVLAAIDMQRLHHERIRIWPDTMKMRIKLGLARGEVVEQDGDCFGDAVNVAARLCDLAGADQIFATESVIAQLLPNNEFRYRDLGQMSIRGKSEPQSVFSIEWSDNEGASEFMTIVGNPADLSPFSPEPPRTIELTWLDSSMAFEASDMPIFLGRGQDAQFVVNDPRVSRRHARIDWRGDVFVLEDLSSYGTWVRFAGSEAVIPLRRQECVLLDKGQLALGASFRDSSVPTVSFRFKDKSPS